jgi:hypothetical protein
MRNYRRLSGDGSVKVVLSGDSNSPPKTASRCEPPSYNSSPTQEVCPSIPAVAGDVGRLTYPANRLHDQTCSSSQPGISSSGLCDLCRSSVASTKGDAFVVKGSSDPKFQKKPVSSPKFTFQRRPQTPLASDLVANFDHSRDVESHAPAGGSDETRGTLRSGAIQAKEEFPPDDDGLSLNPARGELVSAPLNLYRRPASQKRRSLLSTGKERTFAPAGPVGVRGVSADQKNHHVTWETRSGCCAQAEQLAVGMHNHRQRPARESDGLVVAEKSRSSRDGAKEPCCKHGNIYED